jgi:hypothetical protein
MGTLKIDDGVLRIRFTRVEKALGILRDVDLPLSQVSAVDVAADGLSAATGLRAPGYSWPWCRKLGTWRRRGHKTMVDVRRDQPAVRLRLRGHRYDEMLLGRDDAESLAAALRAQVPSEPPAR